MILSTPLRVILLAVLAYLVSYGTALAKGRVTQGLAFESPTLGRAIPYTLYEPRLRKGRSEKSGRARRAVPVLYLLHGHGDDETAWLRFGRIKRTLDRLIATRRLQPIAVIMPSAGNSWYVDDARGRAGFGAVARALTTDFMEGVERRHFGEVAPCAARRAIGGLSMGGFGAVLYAFDNPGKFSAAISLSGSLFASNLSDEPRRRQRLARLFGGVYGTPFSLERFRDWNVFPRVAKVAAIANPPAVWLAAGDDDFTAITRGTVRLHLALKRAGLRSQLRIDDAGHTWSYWRKAIVPALEWLSPRLAPRCALTAGR